MGDNTLLWINMIMGSAEIFVIIIFTIFTIKYIRHFKQDKLDPYTITVFLLVFLTALFKIIPRFVYFPLLSIY